MTTLTPTKHLTFLTQEINTTLDELITPPSTPYETLITSSRYSLLSPGKRLRPLITLTVAEMYGIPYKRALHPACAIEMVHCYSLIHDDLPCMDDDDLRRGRPTLHKQYPEWQALLSGNFLLTKAFETITISPFLDTEQKLRLIQTLTKISGDNGLLGGQVMDLLAENKSVDIRYLKQMNHLKTASLIVGALEFGAIIADAPEKHLTILNQIGENLGLAFQIIDDILDIEGEISQIGKPVGSDINKDKSTYPSVLGYQTSKQWADELLDQTLELIDQLPYDSTALKQIAQTSIKRTN